MNPLAPSHMSTKERLPEVSGLLAVGLIRLQARQPNELFAATHPARPERSCNSHPNESCMTDTIPALPVLLSGACSSTVAGSVTA